MDGKAVMLAVAAAAAFTGSGVMMKASSGLTKWLPTGGVVVLAVVGAALNALAVHRGGELGPAYLMVVGVETVLAFGLGVVLFGEHISALRLGAVALILGGSILLAIAESPTASSAQSAATATSPAAVAATATAPSS